MLLSRLEVESDRRCVDNICASLCRMITAHTDAVPVEQVLTDCHVLFSLINHSRSSVVSREIKGCFFPEIFQKITAEF